MNVNKKINIGWHKENKLSSGDPGWGKKIHRVISPKGSKFKTKMQLTIKTSIF